MVSIENAKNGIVYTFASLTSMFEAENRYGKYPQ
jgi:hypothetical protein